MICSAGFSRCQRARQRPNRRATALARGSQFANLTLVGGKTVFVAAMPGGGEQWCSVRIIAKSTLKGYGDTHGNCKSQLEAWYQVASAANWHTLGEVRQTYPATDSVDKWTVFNIKGNNYRLITAIYYNRGLIYIRDFLTHAEYDKGERKAR